MGAKMIKFPEDFLWGSACSATQIEGWGDDGKRGQNIWDYWSQNNPEEFFDRVDSTVTSDFYNQFEEDIKRMKEIGLNSFRTSISWSRLIPEGVGEVNEEAVAFYNKVFDSLIEHGIEPIIGIYHFDMPMAMQEIGGWENIEVVEAFSAYARKCFQLFCSKIKKWITFNEPVVPVEGGYLYHFHYPCVSDMKRAVQVGYHTMAAHARAVEAFRQGRYEGQIGIVLNLTPSYARSEEKADLEAAQIADLLFNRSFLDPAVKGTFPEELVDLLRAYELLPVVQSEDLQRMKDNKIDFLGVNYYTPRRVQARTQAWDQEKLMPEAFFEEYEWPERKMNIYRGWEIYEKGIYDIAINIRDNYGNIPWYISENGMGVEQEERFLNADGVVEDDYRIDFLKDHLKWLQKAIEEHSNCFGYHMWTFMDNWSWKNAYKNRYGFYRVDIDDNCKRTPKKSAYWFRDMIAAGGFEGPEI